MNWELYVIAGLILATLSSLVMNYFNYVEIKKLQTKVCDNSHRVDYLDRRCIQDLYNTDSKYSFVKDKLFNLQDNLKYMYLNKKDIEAMWDIHNARINSYHEDFIKECVGLHRLLPLLPLADKFDIKRKLKYNKEHADDLKFDLKEIENELKELA